MATPFGLAETDAVVKDRPELVCSIRGSSATCQIREGSSSDLCHRVFGPGLKMALPKDARAVTVAILWTKPLL